MHLDEDSFLPTNCRASILSCSLDEGTKCCPLLSALIGNARFFLSFTEQVKKMAVSANSTTTRIPLSPTPPPLIGQKNRGSPFPPRLKSIRGKFLPLTFFQTRLETPGLLLFRKAMEFNFISRHRVASPHKPSPFFPPRLVSEREELVAPPSLIFFFLRARANSVPPYAAAERSRKP